MDKDPAVLDLLSRLAERLGPSVFVLADHWPADLCAVGIARPDNPRVLAYLSTYGHPPGRYSVELESPTDSTDPAAYEVRAQLDGVTFDELAVAVDQHLKAGHGPAKPGEGV